MKSNHRSKDNLRRSSQAEIDVLSQRSSTNHLAGNRHLDSLQLQEDITTKVRKELAEEQAKILAAANKAHEEEREYWQQQLVKMKNEQKRNVGVQNKRALPTQQKISSQNQNQKVIVGHKASEEVVSSLQAQIEENRRLRDEIEKQKLESERLQLENELRLKEKIHIEKMERERAKLKAEREELEQKQSEVERKEKILREKTEIVETPQSTLVGNLSTGKLITSAESLKFRSGDSLRAGSKEFNELSNGSERFQNQSLQRGTSLTADGSSYGRDSSYDQSFRLSRYSPAQSREYSMIHYEESLLKQQQSRLDTIAADFEKKYRLDIEKKMKEERERQIEVDRKLRLTEHQLQAQRYELHKTVASRQQLQIHAEDVPNTYGQGNRELESNRRKNRAITDSRQSYKDFLSPSLRSLVNNTIDTFTNNDNDLRDADCLGDIVGISSKIYNFDAGSEFFTNYRKNTLEKFRVTRILPVSQHMLPNEIHSYIEQYLNPHLQKALQLAYLERPVDVGCFIGSILLGAKNLDFEKLPFEADMKLDNFYKGLTSIIRTCLTNNPKQPIQFVAVRIMRIAEIQS